MAKFIGIDFGACNIKTASWRGKGAHIVYLSQDVNQNYIPNMILYDMTKAGEVEQKIGDPAKEKQDVENSVTHVKRKLELEKWSKHIPNLRRDLSAIEAATDIFRCLSEKLQKKLNCEAHELQAVITVPVCSSGRQRRHIYQAAKATGIDVAAIVTEPFAAMFSLMESFTADAEDETILIFDFGGSTLDLSLLTVEHEDGIRIEELASAGLSYGGIDIDEAIFDEILTKKYAAEIAEIRENDDTLEKAKTTQELRDAVTKLKERLFEEDNEAVSLPGTFYGSGKHYEFTLTRQEMEDLFTRHNLKGKIFDLLDELFGQTCLTKDGVTLVKPCGGASRMKYVLDLLSEYFGTDIFDSDDYEWEDETLADVAVGAVHYLNLTQTQGEEIEIVSNIPFSLGIAKGNRFKKYIDCRPPYGQRSKRIPLPWPDVKENENRVAVYQSFADSEHVEIGGEDGAVYVGSATVHPDLYRAKDGILLEMELTDSHTLQMIFSELRDADPEEVETQIINLRGTDKA